MSEPKVRFEVYQKVKAENKVLEMELELKGDMVTEQAMEISTLRQIREELLQALEFYANVKSYKSWYVRNDNKGDLARHVIQKAEQYKEKESNE